MWPLMLMVGGFAGATYLSDAAGLVNFTSMLPNSGCDIKGNVSMDSGERIYHVQGQKYYDDTIIRAEYGERWFCSEAEARAAGWRRSRI